MSYEIERRFICRVGEAALPTALGEAIVQAYVSEAASPTVRVRRYAGRCFLTIKTGSGLIRREVEVAIDRAAADVLFEMSGSRLIRKTRYALDGWEIDVFEGKLAGLTIAEAELNAADEPLPPVPEGIELLREVTGERRLSNGSLARLDEAAARSLVEDVMRGR